MLRNAPVDIAALLDQCIEFLKKIFPIHILIILFVRGRQILIPDLV